jgi:acetyltransferase
MTISIRQIITPETALLADLSNLLIDAVDGGASVGFLAPLAPETAGKYWQGVFSSLDQQLGLWIAELDGRVVGSVQLALSAKENGRHRAEIQKLFVLRAHRGQGIATRLMQTAEAFARSQDRSLLVLDTQAGSPAEALYQQLGWQRVGEIPDYAASPDGQLHPTAYYFKKILP